ncbi:prolyl oligopeptidase family serine peptidase [Nonomuraea sp. NPDC050643]|uniref:prolyl oligopeptidase family serine peptidase n=1 Tax=Nonomuraea sp. NPDC050643 TaxID=3155660 RepID=UPI0033EFE81A
MSGAPASSPPGHPSPRRAAVIEKLHGRTVADPYRWLEDGDGPECAAWLREQAHLFAESAAAWPGRASWQRLLEDAFGGEASMPPVWRGGRRFFLRHSPGRPLPALMVAEPGRPAQVLLDPLDADPSGATTLDSWRPSPSGDLVACQSSYQGDERPRLRVLRVAGRTVVDGPLDPGRKTAVAWLADDSGFFYIGTSQGRTGRQLRLHRVGADPRHDPVLFTTELPQLTVATSPDGAHLALSASPGATSGNRLWLARVPRHPGERPRPVPVFDGTADNTRAALKFAPGGRIYAITDADAPFGHVCAVHAADPHAKGWRTVIGQRPGSVLAACVTLTDPATGEPYLLTTHNRHGLSRLRLHTADGVLLAQVAAPGDGHISRLTAPPAGGPSAWFTYTDFVTPPTVHRFDLTERRCVPDPGPPARTPRARHAPGSVAGSRASRPAAGPVVEQITYASQDGTPVRLHLIAPPGRTGPCPVLLTAYGGFGACMPPAYSPAIAAWVKAGGAYAIASVRGGGDEGTGWHAAGSGANKPQAIADFLAAARWLIDHRRTTSRQLAIRGGSHSGFMVAAALTQAPELFAAAVCSDSVTDMLRYQHFGLGHLWTAEFGTADDPDQFATLFGYSPYHRVRPGTAYPAILLTCPRTDPRVDSLHTRKMTAALQHATSSGRPVLLRCESGVGHGPRALGRWLALQADVLAFCAAHTGLRAG